MSTYSCVYRTTLSVTVGTTGVVDDGNGAFHKDFTIPATKVGTTWLNQANRSRRLGDEYGATVELVSATVLRMRWYGDPDAPEGLVNDETTTLDEIVAVYVEAFDLSPIGDDLKELLFRTLRIVSLLGENVINDLIIPDDAGNVVQYRLRLFDSRPNAEAATPDLPDGNAMETGELSRITMSQDIDIGKNDRALLMRVLTDIIATPGV